MTLTVMPLAERGILSITGSDSRRFLQGQCTADAQNLEPGAWTLGGFCTAKGRLYANFYLLCLDDERFWLMMPRVMVTPTIERLSKYAAFFKTLLEDQSLHWHGLATVDTGDTATPSGTALIEPHSIRIHLGSGQSLEWLDPLQSEAYEARLGMLEEQADWLPETHWQALETAAGLVWIEPTTAEQFLPQTISWDYLGGVSFSKGCYTGQEVVARLHYKGSSKKALRRLSGQGPLPEPLSRLHDEADKSVGEMACSVPTEKGWTGLAVLSLQADKVRLQDQPVDLGDWVNPVNEAQ